MIMWFDNVHATNPRNLLTFARSRSMWRVFLGKHYLFKRQKEERNCNARNEKNRNMAFSLSCFSQERHSYRKYTHVPVQFPCIIQFGCHSSTCRERIGSIIMLACFLNFNLMPWLGVLLKLVFRRQILGSETIAMLHYHDFYPPVTVPSC